MDQPSTGGFAGLDAEAPVPWARRLPARERWRRRGQQARATSRDRGAHTRGRGTEIRQTSRHHRPVRDTFQIARGSCGSTPRTTCTAAHANDGDCNRLVADRQLAETMIETPRHDDPLAQSSGEDHTRRAAREARRARARQPRRPPTSACLELLRKNVKRHNQFSIRCYVAVFREKQGQRRTELSFGGLENRSALLRAGS
eukprot:6177248-Pleurochrysis_carterae.AAC.2